MDSQCSHILISYSSLDTFQTGGKKEKKKQNRCSVRDDASSVSVGSGRQGQNSLPSPLQACPENKKMRQEENCCCCSCLVAKSNSLRCYGLQPARPLCTWAFLGKILEWVATSFSKGSSQPRDQTHVSCLAGGFPTIESSGKPRKRRLINKSEHQTFPKFLLYSWH